ncbi:MAG: hypothetical protein K0R21_2066, partial [Anaerocolumna sp.]|nr:hypothetical protein [Anaerocolumna sp.]
MEEGEQVEDPATFPGYNKNDKDNGNSGNNGNGNGNSGNNNSNSQKDKTENSNSNGDIELISMLSTTGNNELISEVNTYLLNLFSITDDKSNNGNNGNNSGG